MDILVNTEVLRTELYAALDDAVDRLKRRAQDQPNRDPQVGHLEDLGAFEYIWPDGNVEQFGTASVYSLSTFTSERKVAVAWTFRPAWGRDDRRRAVVFELVGDDPRPQRWYPWTEFVETDEGRYAAPIPDPSRPRATLADGDRIPARYADRTVQRSDALFRSIRRGPSLRLVVDESDEVEMVLHGHWVARQRGRA